MPVDRWIALVALGVAAAAAALPAAGDAPASPPSAPEVGKPAPPIRLNDHTGTARKAGAGSGSGWTVLAFFPKAMTPG